uniref:ABC transporter domain-containing protein n=1 Tax=Lepisosteus oculatus TaxID=7918 RepID=W5MCE2_LEPOC
PPHVSYTIRTSVFHSMRTDQLQNPVWAVHPKTVPMASFRYNRIFIPLQDMIERAIISVQTQKDITEPLSVVQAMPYPCHFQDQFLGSLGFLFPLLMMLAWMISVASMVRQLVYERKLQLEMYLELMGVKPGTHLIVWLLENMVLLAASSALLVIIFKISGILPHSDSLLLYLFLLDFRVSIIMFSYLISAFFSNANVAAMCGSILYMITFFPFMILVVLQSRLSFSVQTLICLLSTTTFSQGAYYLMYLENNRKGIQWTNMYEAPLNGEDLSFGWMCWVILIDSFLYFVLGWYFNNVFPELYRDKKPWYFIFNASFWRKPLEGADIIKEKYLTSNISLYNRQFHDQVTMEDEVPGNGTDLADSRSLTKEFTGFGGHGVRDLNLTFYRGNVTSMLGPNGAGKTTTISLVTCLLQPSSGTVFVNGRSTHQDLLAVRRELGVCLQEDVLFHCLTVREHLLLYGSIKAPHWGRRQLTQKVSRALDDAGLREHEHKKVVALSGGTKRKLSIAIAFIGDRNTIILDEHTSGEDPPLLVVGCWDMLPKYTTGNTIILTTHHLDEAEIISDRIAILEQGILKCWGSPAYLKQVYSPGYSLTLITTKDKDNPNPACSGVRNSLPGRGGSCVEQIVTSLIKRQIPDAFLKDSFGGELTYIIPATLDNSQYKRLFQNLDANMENLHLHGYGISAGTLEEVIVQTHEFVSTFRNNEHMVKINGEDVEPALQGSYTENDSVMHTGHLLVMCSKVLAVTKIVFQSSSSCFSLGNNKGIFYLHLFGSATPLDEPQSVRRPRQKKHIVNHMKNLTWPFRDTGAGLCLRQLAALLIKRFHHCRRDWKGGVVHLLLPVLFVTMAMALFTVKPLVIHYPALRLTPQMYNSSEGWFFRYANLAHNNLLRSFLCVYTREFIINTKRATQKIIKTSAIRQISPTNKYVNMLTAEGLSESAKTVSHFFSVQCLLTATSMHHVTVYILPPHESRPLRNTMLHIQLLKGCNYSSVDTTRMQVPSFWLECTSSVFEGVLDSVQKSCNLSGFSMKCPVLNISVPFLLSNKGDILYNLTGYNVEKYLTGTTKRFQQDKFGGWSFSRTFPILPLSMKTQCKPQVWSKSSFRLCQVWYNQQGYHTGPSFLNQLNNFILWSHLPPGTNWKQYGITLNSHPYGVAFLDEDRIQESIRQCGVVLCILLGFSILTASLGTVVVRDHVSGEKRLQHISGLNHIIYWASNFIFDMVFYLVPVGLCLGVFTAFQLPAFIFRENLTAAALLLVLFGFSTLSWMYLVSQLFSSPDIAFIVYISVNFVFGLGTVFLSFLPRFLALLSYKQSLHNMYNTLRWAFIIFPQLCLGQGLIELSYNQMKFDLTHHFGIDSYISLFHMDFLVWNLISMVTQGSLFLLLHLWPNRDFHWHQRLVSVCLMHFYDSTNGKKRRSHQNSGEDENKKVNLKDMNKIYNLRNFGRIIIIEKLCLYAKNGECFCLLGINGAGKTTTFKMLTGDLAPSSGQAIIRTELEIRDASSQGIMSGYCPQSNALDNHLTGWEHLYYYCRIWYLFFKYNPEVTQSLVLRLHLSAHVNELVGTYSGGTKRKLSTALALIGKPQVLLLDEPSSGMDPVSKRYLWRAVLREVQDSCAGVLTTHSMEECEAFCTRLAIMVKGKFRCLLSMSRIGVRYGRGYSVKVRLGKDSSDPKVLTHLLTLHFPGTYLKEQHLGVTEYWVPKREGYLLELFRLLEENRESLQIEHCSISQTTLDQVILDFS